MTNTVSPNNQNSPAESKPEAAKVAPVSTPPAVEPVKPPSEDVPAKS